MCAGCPFTRMARARTRAAGGTAACDLAGGRAVRYAEKYGIPYFWRACRDPTRRSPRLHPAHRPAPARVVPRGREAHGLSGAQLFVLRTLAESPGLSLERPGRTHSHASEFGVGRRRTAGASRGCVERSTAAGRSAARGSSGCRRTACNGSGARRGTAQERLVAAVDALPQATRAPSRVGARHARPGTGSGRHAPATCFSRSPAARGEESAARRCISLRHGPVAALDHLGDFTTSVSRPADRRRSRWSSASSPRSSPPALLALIAFFTNLFFFQRAVDGAGLAGGPSSRARSSSWCPWSARSSSA